MTFKKKKRLKEATVLISVRVSPEMWQKRENFNLKCKKENEIRWSDCIRRGFYAIWDEKTNKDVIEILDNDYIPLKVKDRVRKLANKLNEVMIQLETLKSQSGVAQDDSTNKLASI